MGLGEVGEVYLPFLPLILALVMAVILGEIVACLTWGPCSCDVDNISSCLAHVLL